MAKRSNRRNLATNAQPRTPPPPNPPQATGTITVTQQTGVLQYQSPIPPPEILAGYENILPGTMRRILEMVETQEQHRIESESYALRTGAARANWGIVAGVIVVVVCLATGAYGFHEHQQWGAGLVSISGIAGLAGVFVYGTNSQRAERQHRAEIMAQRPPR